MYQKLSETLQAMGHPNKEYIHFMQYMQRLIAGTVCGRFQTFTCFEPKLLIQVTCLFFVLWTWPQQT